MAFEQSPPRLMGYLISSTSKGCLEDEERTRDWPCRVRRRRGWWALAGIVVAMKCDSGGRRRWLRRHRRSEILGRG